MLWFAYFHKNMSLNEQSFYPTSVALNEQPLSAESRVPQYEGKFFERNDREFYVI